MKVWTPDSAEELKGCFTCTNWDNFHQENTGLDDTVEATTDYINFSVDTIIPKKKIKVFPNNKPYLTKPLQTRRN